RGRNLVRINAQVIVDGVDAGRVADGADEGALFSPIAHYTRKRYGAFNHRDLDALRCAVGATFERRFDDGAHFFWLDLLLGDDELISHAFDASQVAHRAF